ncbi:SMP-30/gluconolactonase/LRE family protein [Billgrantia kenyensis]|uniref:SMP-30/gluconolactonase/LRE family protein n=1 Tax=Billgrantia kenyensis TaxID=321266 RepID=A0A7W0ADU5_9GAMM|nr:SMP-30/gluconolactonase/LRE family protein [Halomonas kenyensis]MBA2779631.1 SMP-30/gluconolactonase/LRE family protein [Halomonas kenyensis]MCG6662343.1 SMP-30/gluconolactonase/LRE family protein [Halomonas kenyensis]
MQYHRIEVAVKLDMSLGESPVWSVARQTLYWADINYGHVYAWRPQEGGAPTRIELDEKVGCVALDEAGLVVAAASGILRLPENGEPERLAANPEWERAGQGNRFNDGRCDAAGRLWVGTIDADETSPSAALYCLDKGELTQRLSGIGISNGLAFSPDRRWLYHTDSLTRRILRYPFDVVSGALGKAETWVDLEMQGLPGVPDGAAVDSEGGYWSALYGGGRIVRFSPAGKLVAEHEVPCLHPTMVAFGGSDLSTLYITTATQHLDATGKARWPFAGSLLQLKTGLRGLAEPGFSA